MERGKIIPFRHPGRERRRAAVFLAALAVGVAAPAFGLAAPVQGVLA